MHPIHTTYRLANAGGEFNKLYAMMRKQGVPTKAGMLNWPTIVAERNGQIVGFLSTTARQDAVVVGPVVNFTTPLTTLRLFDAYERLLKEAGVKAYLIPAIVGSDGAKALEKLGLTATVDGEIATYKRVL